MIIIILFLLFSSKILGFSSEIYDDFLFYGKFTKLSSCITKERLFEGPLKDGGCDLVLCKSPKMENVEVVKIRKAPLNENGTGFIALNHDMKKIIVSFRGSTTYSDWASDFEIIFEDYVPIFNYSRDVTKCEDCKVHRGFYKHLRSITEDIIKPIEKIYREPKYKDYQLVLTGHSLGGALAMIVGIEFRVKGFKPMVFAYGTPKIFNEEMMNWVNQVFQSQEVAYKIENETHVDWGLFRLIHEGDYVPYLPPGFRQAGVEFKIIKEDLPHTIQDVDFLGLNYINQTDKIHKSVQETPWKKILDLLHASQHRTYFMEINKCADPDFI